MLSIWAGLVAPKIFIVCFLYFELCDDITGRCMQLLHGLCCFNFVSDIPLLQLLWHTTVIALRAVFIMSKCKWWVAPSHFWKEMFRKKIRAVQQNKQLMPFMLRRHLSKFSWYYNLGWYQFLKIRVNLKNNLASSWLRNISQRELCQGTRVLLNLLKQL